MRLDIFLLGWAGLIILAGYINVFYAREALEFNKRWSKTTIAGFKMLGLSESQMIRISRIWGYVFLAFGVVILCAGLAVLVVGIVATR